jgi:hypothetical protein
VTAPDGVRMDRSPPWVFTGSEPFGPMAPAAAKRAPSPRGAKPRSSSCMIVDMLKQS